MSTITLTNAHGLFVVDAETLNTAILALGSASVSYVRRMAADHAGYPEGDFGTTALDDCNAVEALIIWVESGNHTFGNVTPSLPYCAEHGDEDCTNPICQTKG